MRPDRRPLFLACLVTCMGCGAAEPEPASSTFYEREIGPLLTQSCANSPTQSGCHVAADSRGNALGNLNLSSFETLSRRRDLLLRYGPYGLPGLLVKAVPPFQVLLTRWDAGEPVVITTDVPHAGGARLEVTSASYTKLVRWIERGATESNTERLGEDLRLTPCPNTLGSDPLFDPEVAPGSGDYEQFSRAVSGVLGERCAAGNCHGSPANSLYLTCGQSEAEKRWNYFASSDYVASRADASELLRRALAISNGGTYHEGGDIFASADEPGYRAILEWAEEKGGPTGVPSEPGFAFFASRVQPMLVKRGCMLVGCHSPSMGHEYRLHGGSDGHFGLPATRRNYELSLEQVALESPDPSVSRILRKNLVPHIDDATARPGEPRGILHRGGALFGRGQSDCDAEAARSGPLDEQEPYCVLSAWIELERAERMEGIRGFDSIVYVQRPAPSDRDWFQDFETFRGGADLVRAPAAFDEEGSITVGAGQSLLPLCGLAAGIDVRRPAVSWDGQRIAFSARSSADAPWQIYVIDGESCALEPAIAAAPVDELGESVPDNGELVHDFDPVFSPDGRIVFASTRGNVNNRAVFDYDGPQRTPADPAKLNANLYVAEGDSVRQLTFLLNQELLPSFMSDGRLLMVTEKRAPGFYQLAGRRQNLDGGDYHPLFGQRGTIGYDQLTDVVELMDKDFAAILSDRGAARGAGVLAVVNRSIGIDQRSGDADDYLQDPAARTWQNPDFFQHSIRILDGVGRPGGSGRVYRNPTPLPNGNILVSRATDVPDLAGFGESFDLYVVDPVSGRRFGPVVTDAQDLLWPVAVYGRQPRRVFTSKLDEPNGATRISTREADQSRADVTFLDVPLLASLLFQNTRSRRLLPEPPGPLEVWESLPPEPGVTRFAEGGAFVTTDDYGDIYVRRRRLGVAPLLEDGSVRVRVPGGMPLVMATHARLDGERSARMHHQREELQFYPGEVARQGFRRELFDGVCGSCHGAVSGREEDVAVDPDILTQASNVAARRSDPVDLTSAGATASGPPFP